LERFWGTRKLFYVVPTAPCRISAALNVKAGLTVRVLIGKSGGEDEGYFVPALSMPPVEAFQGSEIGDIGKAMADHPRHGRLDHLSRVLAEYHIAARWIEKGFVRGQVCRFD